jgi:hypothetical protein
MEPYRPVVDAAIADLVDRFDSVPEMDQETRAAILKSLTGAVLLEGKQRTLFDALALTASSLAKLVMGETDQMLLPEGFAYAPA